jgi:hypothetical protein
MYKFSFGLLIESITVKDMTFLNLDLFLSISFINIIFVNLNLKFVIPLAIGFYPNI